MLYYFTLSSPAFKILIFHLYFPVMISLFFIFMNLWIEMYLMMKSVPVTIIIEVQIASLWPARTCLSLLLSSFDLTLRKLHSFPKDVVDLSYEISAPDLFSKDS